MQELLTTPNTGLPLARFVLLPLDITTPHDLPFPFYTTHVDRAFHYERIDDAAVRERAAGDWEEGTHELEDRGVHFVWTGGDI